MSNKTYLGDGAYAEFDGYQLCVTAENGVEVTNTVYLDPSVLMALLRFAGRHFHIEQLVEALNEGVRQR
jgi:hypothetical protein